MNQFGSKDSEMLFPSLNLPLVCCRAHDLSKISKLLYWLYSSCSCARALPKLYYVRLLAILRPRPWIDTV